MINGPNLNLLGSREPQVYGAATLADINRRLEAVANELGFGVEFFQSNHEGAIIDKIHAAKGDADGIVINPGGLTHTSVSLRDALSAVGLPFSEVHLSNVHAREEFRKFSYLSSIAVGTVSGFGPLSYEFGFRGLAARLAG